jgi:23S rRNA (uridine2552-2'-O)-methyltransferase
VYKLIELDRKYRLIRPYMRVLDVGCAPGSWSQYLLEKLPRGKVTGIDIRQPDIRNERFTFIQSDIRSIDPEFLGHFDLVVSDAAPSTTGDKFADSQGSLSLVEAVFGLAESCLKEGGSVVAKLFQGEDSGEFTRSLRNRFREVHTSKPKSSRKESREIYLLARGKVSRE